MLLTPLQAGFLSLVLLLLPRVGLARSLSVSPPASSLNGPVRADPSLAAFLAERGYTVLADGSLMDPKNCQQISRRQLAERGIGYDVQGRFVQLASPGEPQDPRFAITFIGMIRDGLYGTINAMMGKSPEVVHDNADFARCRDGYWSASGPVRADAALASLLERHGYRMDGEGNILRAGSGNAISKEALHRVGVGVNRKGFLAKISGKEEYGLPSYDIDGRVSAETPIHVPSVGQTSIPNKDIPGLLQALFDLKDIGGLDAAKVGSALQSWGVPPALEGYPLLDPGGTATPFGLVLYHGISKNPGRIDSLSGERVSRLLKNSEKALSGAFFDKDADYTGLPALADSWGSLARSGPREKTLDLKPYPDLGQALSSYEAGLETRGAELKGRHGLGRERRETQQALSAVHALSSARYYRTLSIPEIPSPGQASAPGHGASSPRSPPPRARLLPALLSAVEKTLGAPLESEAVEALVKSFPMGESVWRMGAQDLWKDGLTGKGVKVAVIDDGVRRHRELQGAVRERKDFTGFLDNEADATHATHVGGTIHALAPEAEIRSYKAMDGRQTLEDIKTGQSILDAIDAAVEDGNRVVNMSLGVGDAKTMNARIIRRVNKYARQGVIFVISAGNDAEGGGAAKGMNPLSTAKGALASGALDSSGGMASFSQYGSTYDPSRRKKVAKTVFLTPGTHILSSVNEEEYAAWDGTSMSAPHMAGSLATLIQGAGKIHSTLSPARLSRKIEEALVSTARPIARGDLPADAPGEQEFVVVDPVSAWRRGLAGPAQGS